MNGSLDGVHFRVERNGSYEAICYNDLSEIEQNIILQGGRLADEELQYEKENSDKWNVASQILGLKSNDFWSGVAHCEFTLEQLSNCMSIGITRLDYKFNNSPTVETLYEFGNRAEEYGVSVIYLGFLESKYRKDARLVVEGVEVTEFLDSIDLVLDFSQTFHGADEFTANRKLLRAWYD